MSLALLVFGNHDKCRRGECLTSSQGNLGCLTSRRLRGAAASPPPGHAGGYAPSLDHVPPAAADQRSGSCLPAAGAHHTTSASTAGAGTSLGDRPTAEVGYAALPAPLVGVVASWDSCFFGQCGVSTLQLCALPLHGVQCSAASFATIISSIHWFSVFAGGGGSGHP